MKSLIAPLLMSLALALGVAPAVAASLNPELRSEASLAFFGISFVDTSAEGAYFAARPDEAARLAMVRDYVIDQFEERGFRFFDVEPVRAEIDRTTNPANCNDCEVRMAKQLGADYSVVGQVQKVSNLILSMNLVVRDAQTGTMARGMSVDIRGNTDESWQRGMRYILRNNIFKE